jgi:hypothetical protein
MKFRLQEKSRNRVRVTFHIFNQADDLCGSVNVPPDQAGDLLKHWRAFKQQQQQPPPVKLKPLPPMSKAAILRGC